jgi:hypothetical protein
MHEILKVPLPADSMLKPALSRIDYADAYRAEIHSAAALVPEDLFLALFRSTPAWVGFLMRLRNRLVGRLGLKTGKGEDSPRSESFQAAKGKSRGLFKVLEQNEREAVVGEDDKHLDFRVSVHLEPLPGSAPYAYAFTLSTRVMFHNRAGRLYFAIVRPFHSLIVPAVMRGIAKHLGNGAAGE